MNISEKTKTHLIAGGSLVAGVILLYFVGEIILPFIFALVIAAVLINPIILKIQTKIKNRTLALTSFFLFVALFFVGFIVFFGDHVVKDTKRLVHAVDAFVDENETQINDIKNSITGFFDEVYESDVVQSQVHSADTLSSEEQEEGIVSALESVYGLFSNSENEPAEPQGRSWNGFIMLIYTLIYTVVILYSYDYFEAKYEKYFAGRKLKNTYIQEIWRDFKSVFFVFFRQRTKVVLICMTLFITVFSILNIPGAIIIGIIAGLLCYASHFHYLSLPALAIGCWVLSIEYEMSFYIFFGIILFVFILVSILDETIFYDKIMKSVSGMNPAIVILAFVLWIYLLGGFIGTILALPLTQLILIYLDRFISFSNKNLDALETAKQNDTDPLTTE
jgi:predicted PurR-regulated permease PerM